MKKIALFIVCIVLLQLEFANTQQKGFQVDKPDASSNITLKELIVKGKQLIMKYQSQLAQSFYSFLNNLILFPFHQQQQDEDNLNNQYYSNSDQDNPYENQLENPKFNTKINQAWQSTQFKHSQKQKQQTITIATKNQAPSSVIEDQDLIIKKHFTNINEKNASTNKSRVLQSSSLNNSEILRTQLQCEHNGRKIVIQYQQYQCNTTQLTQLQYEKLNSTEIVSYNCSNSTKYQERCYCPADSYGYFCQYYNQVTCKLELPKQFEVNNQDCPYYHSDYYVSEYDGDPPCRFVQGNEKYYLGINATCQNRYQSKLQEGIYNIKFNYTVLYNQYAMDMQGNQVEYWYSQDNLTFNYYVNNSNLKILTRKTYSSRISFIRWDSLSSSINKDYNDQYYLTAQQLTNQQKIPIIIDFSQLSKELIFFGRYYTQINLVDYGMNSTDTEVDKSEANDKFISNSLIVTFDQIDYKEAQASNSISLGRILAMVFLILIIIALIGFFTYRYWRRRKASLLQQNINIQEQEQFNANY